jgi:hypothetical protein
LSDEGVGEDDELSHDGDEDDLGFLPLLSSLSAKAARSGLKRLAERAAM